VTLFGVELRGGIWQVTQDGQFYGHYMADQPAFDAAKAAANALVASGGAADIRWTDRRQQIGASDRAKGLEIPTIGVVRVARFRTGATRIVP
jgi:hypothetical protein